MTEKLKKRYFEILDELFFGLKSAKNKTSALEQLAKVRHVKYEIELFRHFRIPTSEVAGWAKAYFCNAIMAGQKMSEMSKRDLDRGLEQLDYRIQACLKRCTRLTEELNDVMSQLGLQTVNVEKFINYMSFHYTTIPDEFVGGTRHHREFGYEIRYFADQYARENFGNQISEMKAKGNGPLSMQDIYRNIGRRST